MATISLFEYLETVNQLLDEERYAAANQHCRHILSKFPRHIETYRLLAKAHLGQHEYAQAIELFQRVLSADPNDFISHIALSDLFQSESQMDRARWHLERAFELEPYNKAVQDALRRFYAEENGNAEMVAGRLPLTPVAAANIYLRGDLYQSGVDILRETMAESPERIDLELLLAELLWRSGDRVEAADLCLRILEQLPDCVTANAILAQIWLNSGRTDDAKPHLFKVQMLTQMDQVHFDPETAVGAALAADGAAFLPDEVTIEPLEQVEDALSLSEADAEWEPDVTPPAETEADLEGESGDMLEWLSGVSTEAEPASGSAAAPDESAEPPETDWFFDDRAAEGEDTGDLVPSVSEWFGSDWDAETEPEPADEPLPDDTERESEAAMADYLQQGVPEISDSDSGLEAFMREAPATDSEPAPEIPEWLAAENKAEQDIDSQPSDFAESDLAADDSDDDVESDMPNWLAEMTETDFDAVELDPSSASEFLAPDEESEEIDAVPVEAEQDGEAADWLAEISGDIDAIDADEVDAVDFTSDWLAVEDDEAAEVESQPAAERDAAEFAGDWLSDLPGDAQDEIFSSEWLEPEQAASSQETDAEEVAAETAATQSETDWLAALSEEEGAAADEEWLADLSLESAAEADAAAGEPPAQEAEPEPEAAAPESDWLSSLTEDEEASAAGDWLAELATGPSDQAWADDEDDDFAVEAEIDDTGELDDWLADLSRPTGELSDPETAVGDHADAVEEPSAAEEATAVDVPPDDLDQFQDVEADLMGIPGDENDKEEQEKMPEPEEAPEAASKEEMDWLDALAFPEDEEEAVAEDDIDSMLAEMSMEVEDDDLPEWLKASSSAVGDDDSEEADVPDWLLESTHELFETADSADLFAADVAPEASQPLAEPEEDVASEPMAEPPEKEVAPDEPEAVTGPPTSLLSEMTPETVDTPADEEDLEWLSQLGGKDDDEESVPALDWLSEMETDEPEESPKPETAVAPTADEAPDEADVDEYEDYGDEESLPEIPADLDDAMSWLEDLAAEQDTPIEPLPTVADVLGEEEGAPSQDGEDVTPEREEPVAEEAAAPEPEESLDEAMAELDDTLSWLDNLSEEAGALDEASADFVFGDADETEEAAATAPKAAASETADEAEADVEPTPDMVADVPEDLEEAMAWLESLAAKQGAPLEELPSLSAEEEVPAADEEIGEPAPPTDVTPEPVPDVEADDDLFDVDDEIGDAMGWLDELAAGDATLDEAEAAEPEEEETAVISEQETEPEAAPISEAEETPEPALDQDLAAELDWLESVAMTDSEVVDVDASEAAVETSDEELTEALDWLAEMALADETEPEASETAVDEVPEPDAAEAETAVDELSADTGELEAITEEAPESEVDRPEPTTAESLVDEVLFDSTDDIFNIPDDPDEAMAWLQEISAEDVPDEAAETTEPDDEVSDDEETAVEETAVVPEAEAPAEEADFTEDFLAEVPEDPDEAMAWLEQLAARQGADLEELPTVSEMSEDVETPDWITAAAEQEEAAAEAEPEDQEEQVAETPESEAMDEEVAEIVAESEAAVEDVAEAAPAPEEEEDSIPGWLWEETAVDEEVPDEAEWLDTMPEMDITGWLESEEEASVKGGDASAPLAETGPLIAPEPETGPLEEPDLSVVAETPSQEMVPSMLHVDEDQLESARTALAEGDVAQAVTRYQSLVASGEGLMVLISELETAASENEDEPAIRRLLGDAYMRNGQLQKALSVYRQALDRL